jgi:hypothetical protein
MSSSAATIREGQISQLQPVLEAIREKTKAAMDSGPFGDHITLSPEEATLIHRLLFERK